MRYSYRRLYYLDKSLDKPRYGLQIDCEYEDVVSEKNWSRLQLEAMLEKIQTGDEVHVPEMAQLGISLSDVKKNVEAILNAGGSISFFSEKLEFNGDLSDSSQTAMLHLLEMVCQCEKRLIWQRQRVGIERAKKSKKKYKGRKSKFTPKKLAAIRQEFSRASNKGELAKKLGISRAYLYKIVNAGKEQD